MGFPDVSSGDKIIASATRHNALNLLLNKFGAPSDGTATPKRIIETVEAYNNFGAVIYAGQAVTLTDISESILEADICESADGFYGVALTQCGANVVCSFATFGVVEVLTNGAFDASTEYCEPSTGGMFIPASGGQKVFTYNNTDKTAKILLNCGAKPQVIATSEDVVVCQITGGNAQLGYNVQIFGNGPQNAYTATGILYATEIAYGSTLPAGTRIIGHKVAMTITGGTA